MSKPTFEQQMQMLGPDFQAEYYKQQKEEWDKTVFNVHLPLEHRRFVLSFEHPVSLNVHAEYFAWLWQTPELKETTLSDAVTFSRAANRTFMEYVMLHGHKPDSADKYNQFNLFVERYVRQVNEVLEPIKERLIKKMQTLQQLQLKNGNRQISLQ